MRLENDAVVERIPEKNARYVKVDSLGQPWIVTFDGVVKKYVAGAFELDAGSGNVHDLATG